MKQFLSIIFLVIMTVFFYSCKKEYSLEGGIVTGGGNGNTNSGTSVGKLGGTPGSCANATLNGVYGQGIALTDSINYLNVEVTIDTVGTYTIGTDTVNGVYFLASGTFTVPGLQTVKIKAYGTPFNPGLFTNTVKYKGSSCLFDVEVFTVAIPNGTDYFPTTTNSNWTLIPDDPLASPDDTTRITSLGTFITFGGNSYSILENKYSTPPKDSSYFRKGSGLYYNYGDLDLVGFTDGVIGEYIMLKDNVPVGNNWESSSFATSFSGIAGSFKIVSTISQKNVVKQINGKIYNNVIVVKHSFQAKISVAPFTEVYKGELWFAKGIGLIRSITSDVTGTNSYGFFVGRYQIF